MSSDPLHGWKAIADYLDCSVKTAQNWEKERGLPILRPPGGGRPRVIAEPEELDEWLLGEERALGDSGSSEARRLQPAASGVVGLALGIVITALLAAFGWWWLQEAQLATVVEARLSRSSANEGTGRTVALHALDGEQLQLLAFDNIVTAATVVPDDPPTVLVGLGVGGARRRGHVVRLDMGGRELWAYDAYDAVAMGEYGDNGHPHSGFLEPQAVFVHELDGRRVVSVVTHDETWSASSVVVLDFGTGEQLAGYWHPGKLGYGESRVGDPDEDGRDELIVWGHNNALRGWLAEAPDANTPVVFAIEPEQILRWGRAQAWPPRWKDRPVVLPDWYLFLPRALRDSPSVQSLDFEDRDRDGRDDVRVAMNDNAYYYLTATGELILTEGGDRWVAEHPQQTRPEEPIAVRPLHLALGICWENGLETAESYFAEAAHTGARDHAYAWVERCSRLLPEARRQPALSVASPLLQGTVRIGSLPSNGVLNAAGLAAGDVVVAMDGREPLHALDLLFAFYDGARTETLELVVERDGRRHRITLPPITPRTDEEARRP